MRKLKCPLCKTKLYLCTQQESRLEEVRAGISNTGIVKTGRIYDNTRDLLIWCCEKCHIEWVQTKDKGVIPADPDLIINPNELEVTENIGNRWSEIEEEE